MSNKWRIPKDVEQHVLNRDSACVYCGIDFSINHISRKTKPTWEHIINDIQLANRQNIALCCTSCNASKGSKLLQDWLQSYYCYEKGISKETVAEIVKQALDKI